MMKVSSRGLFILAVTWMVVSLLWFLWVKDAVIGIIWLFLGLVELVIAFIRKKKENK